MTTYTALHVTLTHKQVHGLPKVKRFLPPVAAKPQVEPVLIPRVLSSLNLEKALPAGYLAPHQITIPALPPALSRAEYLELLEQSVIGVEFNGGSVILHLHTLPRRPEGVALLLSGHPAPLKQLDSGSTTISFAEFFRAPIQGAPDGMVQFCPGPGRYAYTSQPDKPLFAVSDAYDICFFR